MVWSRRIGGQAEDALLSVSVGFQGSIFVSGGSGATDFPTTDGAICRYLQTRNDSTLAELRAYDSRIQFATFVRGSRRQNAHWYSEEATGVFANPSGEVNVTGCTLDKRSRFGLASPRGDPEQWSHFYQIVESCLQLRIFSSLVTNAIPSASAVAPIRRSHGSLE